MEHLPAHVYAPRVRRVVQRVLAGLQLVAHVRRHDVAERRAVANQVVAADHDGVARGTGVLLDAGVDEAVALHGQGAREEHARNVRHDGHVAGVGKLARHRAVHGLVLAQVHVVQRLVRHAPKVRRAVEARGLARGEHVSLTVLAGLLPGLLRPVARHQVACVTAAHQVHGHARKLQRRAALQKHDAVVVRNPHQAPERLLRVVQDRLEGGRSMAHLHDGHAAALVVEHLCGGFLEDLLGQSRGSRGKVKRACHPNLPVEKLRARPMRAH